MWVRALLEDLDFANPNPNVLSRAIDKCRRFEQSLLLLRARDVGPFISAEVDSLRAGKFICAVGPPSSAISFLKSRRGRRRDPHPFHVAAFWKPAATAFCSQAMARSASSSARRLAPGDLSAARSREAVIERKQAAEYKLSGSVRLSFSQPRRSRGNRRHPSPFRKSAVAHCTQ